MKELLENIQNAITEFTSHANQGLKGNKSATRRARVCSVKLEKLLKDYRTQSIAEDKAQGE